MKSIQLFIQKYVSVIVMVTCLLSTISSFAQQEDLKKYPMKKDSSGQWKVLQERPEKDPAVEVSQTYEFVDVKTGKVTKKIRTFAFYGANAEEVKAIKETHEAFESLVDKYEADRPKVWDATKVISSQTRDLIYDFMGKGFATIREVNAIENLPDEAKAWFSDRLMSNQGRLFMYVLRQHGKDDIDTKLGERIAALTLELEKLKSEQGSFAQKLSRRISVYGKLFGIRTRIAAREVALNVKQKFEFKKDQNSKTTWGPIEDMQREKLTRDVLQLFTDYVKNDYSKLDGNTELSKFQFNSLEKILSRAHLVRTEREFGQKTLIWTLAAATVYLTIQPPIEYTLQPTRDSAMFSGLINLLPTSLYTLHTYMTSGVRVLGDIENTLEVLKSSQVACSKAVGI